MEPRYRAEELEEAKQASVPLERFGDVAHQEKLTRRLVMKLDFRILPILALLFLCSFFDRTNVGNAKIIGLEDDINISDHEYDIGLTVFYLFYICR